MKVFAILFIAALAAAVGYLMGTEDGRRRRDDLVSRIRHEADKAAETVTDAVAETAEAVVDTAEKVAEEAA